MCAKHDKVSASVDCHHIVPVESAKTVEEMKELAYNWHNLMALCIPCHCEIHRQMRSHTWQVLRKMPQAQETEQDTKLRDWVRKVSNGKTEEIKPRPKKGVRKTKYGWLTLEEYKQKEREELNEWAKRHATT